MDSVKVDADGRIAKGQSWFEQYEKQNPQLFNPGRDAYINAYHQTQRDMSAMYNQGYRQTETRNWGQTTSSTLNMVPLVGGFKMWTEMNTGKDAVTGEWHHRSDLESFIGAGLNFASSATMMNGMMNQAAARARFAPGLANWEARNIAAWKAVPESMQAVEAGVPSLKYLQAKFDYLAKKSLLPKYQAIDPNLEAGYTGSFKTGTVSGHPTKSTLGQPIDLNNFDVDYWIKSDVYFKMNGGKVRTLADPEFRKILSETSGFEGLRPNRNGFSIRFYPSK